MIPTTRINMQTTIGARVSRARAGAALLLACAFVMVAAAQAAHPVSGRVIARVMGHEGADWLDRPERVAEEQPDRALEAIGVPVGAHVADVGAGSGYFTVRLSRRVGARGKVYATDIQREMLSRLERRLRAENIGNVELVLGKEDDPGLAPASVDLILMVDVYHELSRPQEMLRRMRASLKPGGRLVLIEYRKEDPQVPIRAEHKMSVKEARQELEAEGFVLATQSNVLPRQHILIFTAAAPASPSPATQTAVPAVLPEALRSHVKDERFGIVTSIRGLPLGVRDGLQTLFGSQSLDIAESDAKLQGADAKGGPPRPLRRLVAAGCSSDHCLVHYERGGSDHRWLVALFRWTPTETRYEWGGQAGNGLATIDEVRSAVLSGQVKGPVPSW
jgi:ubiquinone/menaquinone biosynthesis C-methylase UbiE